MNELVTGDAVVLGLRPAKLPSRALALLIDLAVVGTAFVLVSIGLALAAAPLDDAALAAVAVATYLLVLVGVPIAVETLSHGRSLGKLACGLRVVRDDGGPIRFRHALVRGAMGVVEILATLGTVAAIASLVSARGRRIGDVFAGTLVVRERVPGGRSVAVPPPPPWLVGRFAELDLSGVPDDLWLAVRQYLTRMHQLDAAVGRGMAQRLAGEVAARTGVPAPAGVPAAAFLAAVVNERQARDARRAFAATEGNAVGAPGGRAAGTDALGNGFPAGRPVAAGYPAEVAQAAGGARDGYSAPEVPGAPGVPGVFGAGGVSGVGGAHGALVTPGTALTSGAPGVRDASSVPDASGVSGASAAVSAAPGGAAAPGASAASASDAPSPASPPGSKTGERSGPAATGFAPPA